MREGRVVALPARAVDALAYLIAHRDRIVEKDEIIAAVWRDVAVTDDSLVHAISVIRRTLGDDAAHASYIETIPRRGYRFIGSVEADAEAAMPLGAEASAKAARPRPAEEDPRAEASVIETLKRAPRWRSRLALAAAAMLVAVVAIARYRDGNATPGMERVEQLPPPGTTIESAGVV